MIEENILNWLELGDAIQKLDVYNRKYTLFIFKINYLLSKHINFSIYFHIIIILLFFGQIWELNLASTETGNDTILHIIKEFKKIFLFQSLIHNFTSYQYALKLALSFCIISLILIVLNSILITFKKTYRFLLAINSFLNMIVVNYANGPLFQILLYIFICENNEHIFLKTKCNVNDYNYLSLIVFCILFGVLVVISVVSVSLYINDIGCINGSNVKNKINCNYMPIIIIIKLVFFVLEYLINFIIKNNKIFLIIYQLLFFFINIIISIYVYKEVYFYNNIINILHHYGWYYSSWLSLCIFIKNIANLKNTTLFFIFGIILITFGMYYNNKYKEFRLLTHQNILQGSSLKNIEQYNELLINLSKEHNYKSKTLIAGVIKRLEEFLSNNIELNEIYYKYLNDKFLQKKFNSFYELKILSIIAIIYDSNIGKSRDSTDLSLSKCYFLINKCKNPAMAIWLCTKIKMSTHIQAYYKFSLMEEIKEYLISKLVKNNNIISLKHVQISSAILYNQYVDLFKMKIYDATCSQIEYFDILKNSMTNSKTTENFLRIGEDILSLRKDIINLWDKIILLNPFSNESEKDYILYLDTILQDDVLKRSEIKRYNSLKAEKLPEKMNKYYSIFNQEFSAVLIADGYSFSGKIFYATPNFPSLFMFSGKEILNTSIDDLLPDAIQNFHRYLIEDALKFSNLIYIFKNQRNVLLKGKNGIIFNINLYVKPVPNLLFGLIYFIYIQKIEDPNFIIILDENFCINGFTEVAKLGTDFIMNNNYGLTPSINGYHIGSIIPEFLLQLNYDPKIKSFFILKDNLDIKGYLYPSNRIEDLSDKINKILDIIKEKKISESNGENKFIPFDEYEDFIKGLNSQQQKPYSIFFRIESHIFLKGKYKYYRMYITNDILSENEVPEMPNAISISEEANNFKETVYYQSKIKNINEDSSICESSNMQLIKNKNNNSPHNLIRLKTKLNRQSKILIKKEIDELNKEINKEININEVDLNKQNIKGIKSNINKNIINYSQPSTQQSIFQQSNMESAEFNKLKNEIINKNDSFYIKIMKILSVIFLLFNFILIIFDFIATKNSVDNVIEFLQENLYFTHTKICTACVYNSAMNLQLIKSEIIPINYCPNGNCTSFYSDLLIKCYTEIRVQKYNLSHFYQDFLDIFGHKLGANLEIYNSDSIDHYDLDIDTYLNLLIGHAFKIIANLTNYLDKNLFFNYRIMLLDIYFKNLLSGAINYFNSDSFEGFYGEEKQKRCDKISYNSPLRIYLSLAFVIISSIIIFYLVCKKKRMEIYFLDKLINFTSSNFEEYLKKLEELKKKFRDDTTEEEDKNIDELDLGIDDMDGKNDNSKGNNEMNLKRNFDNKENNPKKKKNKQNKIQQQRLKKRKIMSDYFVKYNLYFGIKISLVFFISSSFYLVTMLISVNMKKNYKEFDSTIEEVNIVFFKSFKTFMTLKEQVDIYFKENISTKLEIPSDSDIPRPKIGNVLMYIIRNAKYSKEYVKKIETLYSIDACQIISNETNDTDYPFCENIFSAILTKGLEQAIVQMSLIITNCIEELESLKKYSSSLESLYYSNTSYSNYEIFVGYYMLESFLVTQKAFEIFRSDERKSIYTIINIVMILYLFIFIILTSFLIYLIYAYKKIENSFLNFIGILPAKFIVDDETFYNAIFKFWEYFY